MQIISQIEIILEYNKIKYELAMANIMRIESLFISKNEIISFAISKIIFRLYVQFICYEQENFKPIVTRIFDVREIVEKFIRDEPTKKFDKYINIFAEQYINIDLLSRESIKEMIYYYLINLKYVIFYKEEYYNEKKKSKSDISKIPEKNIEYEKDNDEIFSDESDISKITKREDDEISSDKSIFVEELKEEEKNPEEPQEEEKKDNRRKPEYVKMKGKERIEKYVEEEEEDKEEMKNTNIINKIILYESPEIIKLGTEKGIYMRYKVIMDDNYIIMKEGEESRMIKYKYEEDKIKIYDIYGREMEKIEINELIVLDIEIEKYGEMYQEIKKIIYRMRGEEIGEYVIMREKEGDDKKIIIYGEIVKRMGGGVIKEEEEYEMEEFVEEINEIIIKMQ